MPRHVLIAGPSSLLASHVAALRLLSSEDEVSFLVHRQEGLAFTREEAVSLVRHAALQVAPDTAADATWARHGPRLRPLVDEDALPRVDEVWWLSGGHRPARGPDPRTGNERLRDLLSRLPGLGASDFCFVGPLLEGNTVPGASTDDAFEALHRAAEDEVSAACHANGVAHRIFRTAPVIALPPPVWGADREGVLQFLEAVHDLKGELEERLPGYFDAHPLRCWAPAGAHLGFVRADQAAKHLLRLARSDGPAAAPRSDLHPPNAIPFAEFLESVGRVHGLQLQGVADREALNSIDRSLAERMGGFLAFLQPPAPARPASEDLRLDKQTWEALLGDIARHQQEARAARRSRAAALFDTLVPRTVARAGVTLSYRVGGTGGTPLVILNALGQGLPYWSRLLETVAPHHRFVIWEPRGTDVGPHPVRLQDQVEDLEAILAQEGIETCHLVGWCTGPKVAVEFYLRHPAAVASMVFLNGTFKCVGSPKEFNTAYERNFESLCGILDRRPAMAASILKSLRLSMESDGSDLLGEPDSEELAAGVLALMNRDLKTHVLAPLRDETVVVNYARQLIDFWACDTRKSAAQVRVPVLLVSAEHDGVASPDMSRMMAQLLPSARHVHIEGATHYCLYDRPRLIAGLMAEFFRSSPGRP